jgi:nucleotide-binding universal stress UspA family protein
MKQLDKLLVPIDLNKISDTFISNAILLAKKYDSEIVILCELPNKAVEESFASIAQKSLNAIVETFKNSDVLVSETKLHYGNVLDNIIKASSIENVNAILIESNSFGKHKNEILSPLVEKVVKKSETPVWILEPNVAIQIKQILCPVDFSDASERALKNAIQITQKFKAELIILSVYETYDDIVSWVDMDFKERNAELERSCILAMDTFLAKFNLQDITYVKKIKSGIPADVIFNYAVATNIELLIIGTTGKSNIGKFFMGSVSQTLIRKLPCSIITTKSKDLFNSYLESQIHDIEQLIVIAEQFEENGSYKEAINQYEICLTINGMHIPSLYRIAKLYRILGDATKALQYENTAVELMNRIWDKKIEGNIRKHYTE